MSASPPALDRRTWTPERALAFARGLYHVAACDGVDEREADIIGQFLTRAGLDLSPHDLADDPFDYAEAARHLDSPWLRRVFLRACHLVILADGVISDQERDCMRAIASALGLGEQLIMKEGLPREAPTAGDLADLPGWIARQFVDLVSWDDESQRAWFWPFPHPTHPVIEGADIEVGQGQTLLIRVEEDITDRLGPGIYSFTPNALPGLTERIGWAGGPTGADFIFVSHMSTPLMRWGTADPARVEDPTYGPVPLRAFGRFALKINDAHAAWQRFGRSSHTDTREFESRARRIVAGRFAQALKTLIEEDRAPLLDLLTDPHQVVKGTRPHLDRTLGDTGLSLTRFYLEHLTAPAAIQQKVTVRHTGTHAALTGAMPAVTMTRTMTRTTGQALYPCPKCTHPVPMQARFCSQCGFNLKRPCSNCSAVLSLKAKFCSTCGAAQEETE